MTRAALVILVTLTSGCTASSQQAPEPVQPERKPAARSERVPRRLSIFGGPVSDAGAKVAKEAKASPDAGWRPPHTGIAVCDEYLQKYYVCLRDHVSVRQRVGLRKSLDTFSMVWRRLGRTPAGRMNAEQDCLKAMAKAQASTKAFRCKW
jgi:hypothetical protein